MPCRPITLPRQRQRSHRGGPPAQRPRPTDAFEGAREKVATFSSVAATPSESLCSHRTQRGDHLVARSWGDETHPGPAMKYSG